MPTSEKRAQEADNDGCHAVIIFIRHIKRLSLNAFGAYNRWCVSHDKVLTCEHDPGIVISRRIGEILRVIFRRLGPLGKNRPNVICCEP